MRHYQLEMDGVIPPGRGQPLWWTLRRPARPADLSRGAPHVRAGQRAPGHHCDVFTRCGIPRPTEWPRFWRSPLTDVQTVLGHAQLSTTQIYLTPRKEDFDPKAADCCTPSSPNARPPGRMPPLAPGYRPETIEVLFTLNIVALNATAIGSDGRLTGDTASATRAASRKPVVANDPAVAELAHQHLASMPPVRSATGEPQQTDAWDRFAPSLAQRDAWRDVAAPVVAERRRYGRRGLPTGEPVTTWLGVRRPPSLASGSFRGGAAVGDQRRPVTDHL